MTRTFVRSVVFAAALLLAAPATAQLQLPDLSPRAEVMQTVGITTITVNYASPGVKGRTIWGELVPYGKLWRTGANAATTIEVSTDVKIGGKDVPAGKYAIFTIPNEKSWTVIINKNPKQGGTRNYDEKLDQARFEVKPAKANKRERMTFFFSDTVDASTRLDMEWAEARISLPIEVATADMVNKGIEGYANKSARAMANAARFHKRAGNLDGALAMVNKGLAVNESWFALWIKADILAAKGDIKAAYPIAQKAYDLGMKDDYFFWKDTIAKALKDWESKR